MFGEKKNLIFFGKKIVISFGRQLLYIHLHDKNMKEMSQEFQRDGIFNIKKTKQNKKIKKT